MGILLHIKIRVQKIRYSNKSCPDNKRVGHRGVHEKCISHYQWTQLLSCRNFENIKPILRDEPDRICVSNKELGELRLALDSCWITTNPTYYCPSAVVKPNVLTSSMASSGVQCHCQVYYHMYHGEEWINAIHQHEGRQQGENPCQVLLVLPGLMSVRPT